MRNLRRYIEAFLANSGRMDRVRNIVAHYLYGTEVSTLAKLSNRGIVYNPPGYN